MCHFFHWIYKTERGHFCMLIFFHSAGNKPFRPNLHSTQFLDPSDCCFKPIVDFLPHLPPLKAQKQEHPRTGVPTTLRQISSPDGNLGASST